MKTPHSTLYRYTAEAVAEANKLKINTVSEQAHKRGMETGEPLIVAMDCLLKYADSYRQRLEQPLAEDRVLGPSWLAAAKGIRELLNGDGAHAMAQGITTDSKDNGCIESMFWAAMKRAGFEEKDL